MREAHDVVTGESGLVLRDDGEGLALVGDGVVVRPDFGRMAARLRPSNLSRELLVRAAKVKHAEGSLTAVDATAGLGDDSLLLAAAGFEVRLYERNPTVAALLRDALRRAQADPRLYGNGGNDAAEPDSAESSKPPYNSDVCRSGSAKVPRSSPVR